MPTTPPSLIRFSFSSLVSCSRGFTGGYSTSSYCLSFSTTMLITLSPVTTRLGSMAFTVPETLLKTGTDM